VSRPDPLPAAVPAAALPPVLTSLSSAELVGHLELQPHPEGGWYREVHRSAVMVRRADGAIRCALTQILYLLPAGGISRWHRVRGADETWLFVAGSPLELWQLPPEGGTAVPTLLGPAQSPLAVVPAGGWQAARSPQGWSLVSCAVGPGFAFEDFELLVQLPSSSHPAGVLVELL
jgi:predicted cupin superfamily sugar epimerase